MSRFMLKFIALLVICSLIVSLSRVDIVEASGSTIYIRADGSIEPSTAPILSIDNVTYTFTGNISGSIVVERDNIVVDGAGYTLQGTGAYLSEGIDLYGRSKVTIKNINIENCYYGIRLYFSSNNNIYENNMTNYSSGTLLISSSNNSLCGNNITANHWHGISLESSSSNHISGNNITAYNWDGIHLESSSSNSISGNNITNSSHGILLKQSLNNNICENNIAKNGYFAIQLESSSNNNIYGNKMTEGFYGMIVYSSSNNVIYGNSIIANHGYDGIHLESSSNNSIYGNSIANNHEDGIELLSSANNTIYENSIIANGWYGIELWESSNNSIYGNSITYSYQDGIWIVSSSNNSIYGNAITDNGSGVCIESSSNNSIYGNTIAGNNGWDKYGICLKSSSNNSVYGNSITNNTQDGIRLSHSSNDSIYGNSITNSKYGLEVSYSANNTIYENNITDNSVYGVSLIYDANNNLIYHNNFVNNTIQAYSWEGSCVNIWNVDYPSGGNYWSDYPGVDLYSGIYQTETGSDGIGDTPYNIDALNRDHYPLINLWSVTPPSSILNILPNRGGNTGKVTVNIRGIGFQQGARVNLVRQGYVDIEGFDTQVPAHTQITTTFNLTGKAPGAWDIVVTLPDATELRMLGSFTILSGGLPRLHVDVVTRPLIRVGREGTAYVVYQNLGDVDTFDVILLIRMDEALKPKVNIPPPNLAGVNWEQVPKGSLVDSQITIPIWIYHVPAHSSQVFSVTFQATYTGSEINITAQLIQPVPNRFSWTGDFRFANTSSVHIILNATYPVLLLTDYATMPPEDFGRNLASWLEVNQNQIQLIPYNYLAVAAATNVLGTPLNDTAMEYMCDPLAPTRWHSSIIEFFTNPWYGNYTGPGWYDIIKNGIMDELPADLLDAAARWHDQMYKSLKIGGIWDVIWRTGGKAQNMVDEQFLDEVIRFDPWTSYKGVILGTIAKELIIEIFSTAIMFGELKEAVKDMLTLPAIKAMLAAAAAGSTFVVAVLGFMPSLPLVGAIVLFDIVTSIDPNDKAGPAGFGSQRFIPSGQEMLYVIFFENLENATAEAEYVVITDQLDPDLDWNTLTFREMSHPQYATVNFNSTTGTVTWSFVGINLPPNKNPPEGEGYVMFTIRPKPDLPTGTEIRNKAKIVFDVNPPIDTPEFINTIDSQPPSSSMNALPSHQPLSFNVSWSGTDAGSGIRHYNIYVSSTMELPRLG